MDRRGEMTDGEESLDMEYPSTDGYAYTMVGGMHDAATGSNSLSKDFNPSLIRVVFDFFKLSLLTPVDIDKFIRDLDSDKIEVWSMLIKEQRDGGY
nr:hypothetical protein [Tanacetum cinerariifolium]